MVQVLFNLLHGFEHLLEVPVLVDWEAQISAEVCFVNGFFLLINPDVGFTGLEDGQVLPLEATWLYVLLELVDDLFSEGRDLFEDWLAVVTFLSNDFVFNVHFWFQFLICLKYNDGKF